MVMWLDVVVEWLGGGVVFVWRWRSMLGVVLSLCGGGVVWWWGCLHVVVVFWSCGRCVAWWWCPSGKRRPKLSLTI